mmetsp:Transcript_23273/g.33355  ORF Transcript_23273/g.33355 Transcript_23273/m.33355 type:complete len:108 (-) Transcript_23273:72-395(-)
MMPLSKNGYRNFCKWCNRRNRVNKLYVRCVYGRSQPTVKTMGQENMRKTKESDGRERKTCRSRLFPCWGKRRRKAHIILLTIHDTLAASSVLSHVTGTRHIIFNTGY